LQGCERLSTDFTGVSLYLLTRGGI
jgi:hypothetical protein